MASVTPSVRTATIDFDYGSGTDISRLMDRQERIDFAAASGFGILVDGITPNTKLTGSVACDLVLRSISSEVHPATTMPSNTGKIFGQGYCWRVRFRNTETGECTGLTPIYTPGYNMGIGGVSGSTAIWVGATAYFYIAGIATTNGMDTLDLFRNTSGQTREFYLVTSVANPGASTKTYITDNSPDEDIINNELASVSKNPSYFEGIPTAYSRLYQHGTGRLWLYGIRRQGKLYGARAIMLAGANLITNDTADPPWHRGLEGMMFRWTSADGLKRNYRIIEVLTGTTMMVTPAAPAGSSNIDGVWEIVDDRDARNIQMSQPTSAVQYDPEDILTIGRDVSDPLHGVFALGDKTFCLTRRRLIGLDGDLSEQPTVTTRQNVVSETGCVGLWAWCVTPFGVVFVNDRHGVMVYDGTGLPRCLGRNTPFQDFEPKTQFESIDRSHLEDTYVEWDAFNERVVVSYTRDGREAEDEVLVFDPKEGIWRGPWRQRIYRMGRLYNNNGEDAWVQGDDMGQLHVPDAVTYDIVADTEERVVSAYSAVSNKVTYTGTELAGTGIGWGVPVIFTNGSGTFFLNWIAYTTTTKVMHLLLVPETAPSAGWTFRVGQIHWTGRTAWLDFNEPGLPKILRHLELRYERVEGGADNLVVSSISDGGTLTATADPTATPSGLIKASVHVPTGGSAVTVQLHGRVRYGGPKVTQILAHLDVGGGATENTVAVQARATITPTVSP